MPACTAKQIIWAMQTPTNIANQSNQYTAKYFSVESSGLLMTRATKANGGKSAATAQGIERRICRNLTFRFWRTRIGAQRRASVDQQPAVRAHALEHSQMLAPPRFQALA